MPDPIYAHYADVRGEIRTGDLLLYRRVGLVGWLIGVAGRSPYCHAGMAVWQSVLGLEVLRSLEMLAGGGRDLSLARQVERFPGRIDVFRANAGRRWPGWRPVTASMAMSLLTHQTYGWWHLVAIALQHLPIVRLLMRPQTDDEAIGGGRAPICSEAVAIACRAGGVDPVPQLADRVTEPADLARSPFFAYRFTLVP